MKVPLIRAVLPLVLGHFLLNKWCSVKIDGQFADAVREKMWPILLVFIGLAWEWAEPDRFVDVSFLVLMLTMCSWFWLWCHGYVNQSRLILILIAIVNGLVIWLTAKNSPKASLLLMPLMIWILFAEKIQLPKIPKITVQLPRVVLERAFPS